MRGTNGAPTKRQLVRVFLSWLFSHHIDGGYVRRQELQDDVVLSGDGLMAALFHAVNFFCLYMEIRLFNQQALKEPADQRNNQDRWQSEVNNLKEMCCGLPHWKLWL